MVLLAVNFDNLHHILQNLYVDMMPLCSQMTGVAKGLAGLGALFYVAYRVWQSLARAEPIDVFPLLRPFALGLCIMFFPTLVLGTLNSVMSPIVTGTHRILETQTFDMNEYRRQKDKLEFEAMKRNPETAYLVDKESFDNKLDELGALDAIEACGMYMDRAMYNMKNFIISSLKSVVEAFPPKSGVKILPSDNTVLNAESIFDAASFSPMYLSISIAESNNAVGLALFCPFISGAEPCTGSNTA